jgi:hypothetical protein
VRPVRAAINNREISLHNFVPLGLQVVTALHLLGVSPKFSPITMFVVVNVPHLETASVYYLSTKFHVSGSSFSLVIGTKQKVKYRAEISSDRRRVIIFITKNLHKKRFMLFHYHTEF